MKFFSRLVFIIVLLFILKPYVLEPLMNYIGDTYLIDKSDTYEEMMIGRWNDSNVYNGASMVVFSTYSSDHKVIQSAKIMYLKENLQLDFEIRSIWSIANGYLVQTVYESSHPEIVPIGTVDKMKIISIDDKECIYTTDDGETKKSIRVD